MSDDLRLSFERDVSPADEDFVKQRLGEFNISVTGHHDYDPAYQVLRDTDGNIRGALLAYVWGKWLHVDTFWIDESLRGQGWGSKMLEAAHRIGREKGAVASWLDTFSWQARPFYERFGYETVFEIGDHPAGHSRYFMQKKPL